MNKSILADKVFSVYTNLPHCIILRNRHMKEVRRRFDREHLEDISIISTNCVGGEISYLLNLGFRSPFVNISMNRREFVQLASELKRYMELPLQVRKNENGSCTGVLEGAGLPAVTIHFPHDSSPVTVVRNWERRKSRINYDRLVLIVDDRGLTEEDLELYDRIPAFRKICLTASREYARRYGWCHQIRAYEGEKMAGKYNAKSADGLWKFTKLWDYVSWLNGN